MSATRLAVFCGAGDLPVKAVEVLQQKGYMLVIYGVDKKNWLALERACRPQDICRFIRYPGKAQENLDQFRADAISQALFVGKVNKWTLLKAPVFDKLAWEIWHRIRERNDDAVMLAVIHELAALGIEVVPQTLALEPFLVPAGIYSNRMPTEAQQADIQMGMTLAKEMGRLDIGQTVVVSQGMAITIEAIEGTDQAILRAKKWIGKQGGVVAKVEKPGQDTRFDIPTVGPRTLQSMKKAGLDVLAVEAGKTLVLEPEKMTALANRWNMVFVAQ